MTMMEQVQEFSPEDLAVREALARRIRKHINRGTAMMPAGVEAAVVVGALLDVLGEIATGAPCNVTQGQLLGGATLVFGLARARTGIKANPTDRLGFFSTAKWARLRPSRRPASSNLTKSSPS